jgi:ubiquinone/menaquinone biosynthesis C-methylase UbiE
VDYEEHAHRYHVHRALAPEALDAWGEFVRPHAMPGGRVVDCGAGTCLFGAACRSWGAADVIAADASREMLAAADPTIGVHRVQGRATALPVADAGIDIVWVSAAVHHFPSLDESFAEFKRVLRPDGVVIIREYVPGHTPLPWLELFPGNDKSKARYPSIESITAALEGAGLRIEREELIVESVHALHQRAEFVRRMRHADTLLTALTDAEIDAGLAALDDRADEIDEFALTGIVARALG